MEINQQQPKFQPIIVILETKEEASALLTLADSLEFILKNCPTNRLRLAISEKQELEILGLFRQISDAFTNCEVML